MKYIKKIPAEDRQHTKLLLDSGWRRLKEPKKLSSTILLSLPISLVLMFLVGALCAILYPPFRNIILGNKGFAIEITVNLWTVVYVLLTLGFFYLHELIHAAFVPDFLHSKKVFWGFNGMFCFVYTNEKISKQRFLLISIMPLLILSIIFPILMSTLKMMNNFIVFLCILNAGGACVDIFNMFLIGRQVPSDGYVINNGLATFFK
ncbi:DUF3267 domain-containing protein [Alkaliphilus crotonatoxidans]